MEFIAAAGNTEIPAYLVLLAMGFSVTRISQSGDDETWEATSPELSLTAPSPLQLLGLAVIRQQRGEDWLPTDDEVESFLGKYYPEAG